MSPTAIELQDVAKVVRRDILTMLLEAGAGHPGGSLSVADILVTLYWEAMDVRPDRPAWEERDRLILSKAHAAPALYAALARRGYFDVRELLTFRRLRSILQGFPDAQRTPGVDASVGSPGQGLSIGNGIAMAAKRGGKGYRIFCVMGDGETHEGQVWEAAMTAAHHKLDNVCAVIDRNMMMGDGSTEDIVALSPLAEKWKTGTSSRWTATTSSDWRPPSTRRNRSWGGPPWSSRRRSRAGECRSWRTARSGTTGSSPRTSTRRR